MLAVSWFAASLWLSVVLVRYQQGSNTSPLIRHWTIWFTDPSADVYSFVFKVKYGVLAYFDFFSASQPTRLKDQRKADTVAKFPDIACGLIVLNPFFVFKYGRDLVIVSVKSSFITVRVQSLLWWFPSLLTSSLYESSENFLF